MRHNKSPLFNNPSILDLFISELYDNAPNAVFILELDGKIYHANDSAFLMIGREKSSTEIIYFENIIDQSTNWHSIKRQLNTDNPRTISHKIIAQNNHSFSVESHFHLVGEYICCQTFDKSESLKLLEEAQRFQSIFDNTTDAIMVTDSQNKIIEVNRAFEKITGYNKFEVYGQNPSILSSKMHESDFYENMWQSIKSTHRWQGEIWNRRKDGKVYPEWLTINTIFDANAKVSHRFAIFSDLSQQKKQEKLINHQNFYDALTGLPNRALFYEHLISSVKLAKRNQNQTAILFLDIDLFRVINDSYGHLVGDKLLQTVADRLQTLMRKSDTVARFSGDEFVIIANELNSSADAEHIAHMILEDMSQPFTINKHKFHITLSIGIALFPDDSIMIEELTSIANQTLNYAKEQGQNTFKFYTQSIGKQTKRKIEIKEALVYALEAKEFYPVYQPIICAKTHKIKKFEVLARWHSSKLNKNISPAEFIPIAEEYGLIEKLGAQIAEHGLQDIIEINKIFSETYGITINRSVKEFNLQSGKAKSLESLIEQYQVPLDWLTIEITESMLIDEHTKQEYQLGKWKALGAKIAIDDFGTGYSSLSYLTKFPIDIVKIDQSFVRKIDESDAHKHLIEGIINLSKSLKLTTIVEGVETQEQLEFVQICGADFIQGYYFSKPQTKVSLIQFISAQV